MAASTESPCFWSQSTSAADGLPVKWDVIHYNEGLHSLWPRVNTSVERQQWAWDLGNWTRKLQQTGAKMIYATMTPFMPEKYLNPNITSLGRFNPIDDVELKNSIALETVKAQGVTTIDDLYSAITAICGKMYRNCSLCDDESQYHPQGQCGYHYSPSGWQVLAQQTMRYIDAALESQP